MRVYLPATVRILEALRDDEAVPVGEDVVVAEGESEDEEYDALLTAAEASAGLVAELDPGARRRVVIVAELATSSLPERVALADVVAIHADAEPVPGPAAESGVDLGWYATQELGHLLDD